MGRSSSPTHFITYATYVIGGTSEMESVGSVGNTVYAHTWDVRSALPLAPVTTGSRRHAQ